MTSDNRRRRAAGLGWLCAILACAVAGLASVRVPAAGAGEAGTLADLTLDHILVGAADLEAGIRELTALTGVTPVRGGQHPGRGTQNALLSLGPHTYLELIAPVAGAPANEMTKGLAGLRALTPVGWAVGIHHGEAAMRRLEAAGLHAGPLTPGARVRPDGRRLAWSTAELLPAGDLNPFLIEWSADTVHPSADSPGGCTLVSLTALGPAAATAGIARLAAALGGEPVTVEAAREPALRLVLQCSARRVTLPAPGPPTSPRAPGRG